MKLFKVIFDIIDVFHKASQIRQDPERSRRSCRFAITSIINALFAAAFAYAALWLFNFAMEENGLISIFVLVVAVVLAVGVLVMLLQSVVRLIAQFTINRGVFSWIALVAFIAIAAVAVYLILLI